MVIVGAMNPISDVSSSVNLSNETKLGLGITTGGETGITLVLSLPSIYFSQGESFWFT